MPVRVNDVQTGQLSATVAAVGTLEVRRFNEIAFTHTGMTSETLTIQISCDNGMTWSTANTLGCFPITGAAVVTTIPTTAAMGYTAKLPPCTHIKFVKSGTAQTVSISYTLRQS